MDMRRLWVLIGAKQSRLLRVLLLLLGRRFACHSELTSEPENRRGMQLRTTTTLAIVALLLVAGCGTRVAISTSVPSETETPVLDAGADPSKTGAERSANPIIDFFTTAVGGYTPQEVWEAVETQRQESAIACVEAEGWTVDESLFPPLPSDQDSPPYFGGVVAEFENALDQWDLASESTDDADPLPDEFWTLYGQCYRLAVDAIADPRDALFSWLEQYQEDMGAEFLASAQYTEAAKEFGRCIQATGFDVVDPNEASNQMVDRAQEVVDQLRQGILTKAEAVSALSRLASEEKLMAEAFEPCYEVKQKAEQRIWANIEQAVLDEHGDELAIGLNEVAAAVRALVETLHDRQEDY